MGTKIKKRTVKHGPKYLIPFGRGERIRTFDPLLPKQNWRIDNKELNVRLQTFSPRTWIRDIAWVQAKFVSESHALRTNSAARTKLAPLALLEARPTSLARLRS